MYDIDCNIIKDLLPTYIEGLTSGESNQMIENHLDGCEECRLLTAALKSEVKFSSESVNGEIDYMKKVRSKRKKLLITTIAVCALVFGALLAIGVKTFIIGSPVAFYELDYDSDDRYMGIGTKFDPETNELTVYGELVDTRLEFRGMKVELDKDLADAYNVTVYGAPRLFSGKQSSGGFEEIIKIPDDNQLWSVYSMGPTPHDVAIFWSNAEYLEAKYALPKAKLEEYLAGQGGLFTVDSALEYAFFDEISGEPCYVFDLRSYRAGAVDFSAIDYAVSEDGGHIYRYNLEQSKWELQNRE